MPSTNRSRDYRTLLVTEGFDPIQDSYFTCFGDHAIVITEPRPLLGSRRHYYVSG